MAIAAADKVVHGNDLTYITQQYKSYFQAKESGKGLSTNDYTTSEKEKLAGIDTSADVNVIEAVQFNGTALTPDANKAVNVQALPIGGGTATGAIKVKYGSLMGFSEVDNGGVVVSNGSIPASGSTAITESQYKHNKITVTNGDGDYDLAFPAKAGTIALTSDVPTALSDLTDDVISGNYLPLSGGTVTGPIIVGEMNGQYLSTAIVTINSTHVLIDNGLFNANQRKVDIYCDKIKYSASSSDTYDISFPSASGTIALTSNIPTVAGVYAPLASPDLTGTPTAPTATAGTNTTQVATTAFVTTAISNAMGSVAGLTFNTDYSTYADLAATTGTGGVIYLIPNSGTSPNSYDEYFWNGSGYEKFGTTDVDLSGYVQTSALETLTTSEITTLLNL